MATVKVNFKGLVSEFQTQFLGEADKKIGAEFVRDFSPKSMPIIENIATGALLTIKHIGGAVFEKWLEMFRAELAHNADVYAEIHRGDIVLKFGRTSGAETPVETVVDFADWRDFVNAGSIGLPKFKANATPNAEPEEIEL